MNKGLVDLASLRDKIKKADFEGKSSYCFKIGSKIIKIYARIGDPGFFTPPDTSEIVDFSKYYADTIVFPDDYMYENGEKVGEIIRFIDSKRLDQAIDNRVIIKKMINSYENVLSDFALYNNIDMVDLCYVNILYSNKNGFHIIDTTDWKIANNSLSKNIYFFNSSIMNLLVEYFQIPYCLKKGCYKIDDTFLDSIYKYGSSGIRLADNFMLLDQDKCNFLNFMFSYLEVYRIHYGTDAYILKDIKELTKVLKKG